MKETFLFLAFTIAFYTVIFFAAYYLVYYSACWFIKSVINQLINKSKQHGKSNTNAS